jgi:CRISPR-associated protein Csd1
MILQALCAYYERMRNNSEIDIAEPGFSAENIHAEILLNRNGNLLQFNDLRVQDKSKLIPRKFIVPQSCKRTGSKPYEKPFFLWDNTGFVLGRDVKNDEKTKLKHEYFKRFHLELLSGCSDVSAQVLLKFLEGWSYEKAEKLDNWAELAGSNIVFRIDGERQYLHDKKTLKQVWQRYLEGRVSGFRASCLITNQITQIARTHPAIKGVDKAQVSGAALISFNDEAYESYGKKQNYNSPVGISSTFEYTTALNYLLARDSEQKIKIGDTTTVFWTQRDSPIEGMLEMVFDPKDAQLSDNKDVRNFLETIRAGKRPSGIDTDVQFYILGLSPNAARLAVRFWYVCSVGELEDRIGQHFSDMQLQRSFDSDPEFPGIRRILWETYNKKSKTETASPLLAGALVRSILEGSAYPQALQNAVINRIHADQDINYVRTAILKAILVRKNRKYNQGMEVKMSLDKENKNPAYLLGRLFAVLEKAQQDALGQSINATIRDRFFGSASATPAVVFPQLLRLVQHHIAKSERGAFYDKQIEEILCDIKSFPPHMVLDQQGLFVIGYYQQKQQLWAKKEKQEEK